MRFLVLTALLPASAMADSVVATRTIRAQSVIAAQDVAMVPAEITGALTATDAAVGLVSCQINAYIFLTIGIR